MLGHNLQTFGAVNQGSWTSGNLSGWSPGSLGGTSGLKVCKVVNSVVTTDCANISSSASWVGAYQQYVSDPTVTWEVSLQDPTNVTDSYAIFKRDPAGNYVGTVSSTNTVQVTADGMEMILVLYKALPI